MEIHVNDVSKVYGTKENQVIALNHASMTILEGDFISIMGPSGSGNSTLLPVLTARKNILMPLLLDKKRADEGYLQELASFLGIENRILFSQTNLREILTAKAAAKS